MKAYYYLVVNGYYKLRYDTYADAEEAGQEFYPNEEWTIEEIYR